LCGFFFVPFGSGFVWFVGCCEGPRLSVLSTPLAWARLFFTALHAGVTLSPDEGFSSKERAAAFFAVISCNG